MPNVRSTPWAKQLVIVTAIWCAVWALAFGVAEAIVAVSKYAGG